MILYPAVDILGGRAVRLTKGDFDASKVYDEDPLEAARAWVQGGAEHLHVVDLDGARAGYPQNLDHLRRIAAELDVPVQFGGGLRSLGAIDDAFDAGAERAILGTAAFAEPHLLGQALGERPGQVLVSVDVRGGRVATEGWTVSIDDDVEDVIGRLRHHGVCEFVYTNVDRDGMLGGIDLGDVRRVAGVVGKAEGGLLYSGGIGSLADLEALAALGEPGLKGVIVGKALYERRFTVAQAQAALDGRRRC